jgi:cellulase/cellobiase CelA1
VKGLVARVKARGMTPVLDLHWSYGQYTGNGAGCSDVHATCQKPMPDAQYAPAFWASVARTFGSDRTVVFDLFNEPYPDRATSTADQAWACWRDGGTCPGIGYEVAGMQDLVDAVRGTGATNVVLAGGLTWSNDLSRGSRTGPATRPAISPPRGTSTTSTPAPASRAGTRRSRRSPAGAARGGRDRRERLLPTGSSTASCGGSTRRAVVPRLDLEHLGLLLRAVPDQRLRRHADVVRDRAARPLARRQRIARTDSEERIPMRRVRTAALAAAALVIGTTGAALATGADLASAAVPCTVAYTVQNQWNTGFTDVVVVTNNGAARTSWTVRWSYAGDQRSPRAGTRGSARAARPSPR